MVKFFFAVLFTVFGLEAQLQEQQNNPNVEELLRDLVWGTIPAHRSALSNNPKDTNKDLAQGVEHFKRDVGRAVQAGTGIQDSLRRLQKRIDNLEENNKFLISQIQILQDMVSVLAKTKFPSEQSN